MSNYFPLGQLLDMLILVIFLLQVKYQVIGVRKINNDFYMRYVISFTMTYIYLIIII